MAIEVTMPQMGADMTEGTLVKWFKQVGERVERGEMIAEIETDKANVELEAFESGTLIKQVVNEGDLVPVGEVIALLGEAGEAAPEAQAEPATAAERPATRRGTGEPRPPAPAPGSASVATQTPRSSSAGERVRISPVAKRIADDNAVDISTLSGSGPGGRILRRDVEAALEKKPVAAAAAEEGPAVKASPTPSPAPAAGTVEPLTRIRQTIARRMSQSKQQQPHYYLTLDVDMTAAMAFRAQFNGAADEDHRATINDLVVKACAIALGRHPKFTARFTEEGLAFPGEINIDIGIALDEGLIAPSLLDCGSKSLGQIAADSKSLIGRAKANKLRADEYGQGVFTITNLGAYGVETLIGIINPPQAAILGAGSVMPKPVVIDDQVVVRQVMKVALSADHRVTDGIEGAQFIKEIQRLLENPASLAL
jgi:pyruvate dehydrogenase E2 component (dihydrolipoamide acetyltransferase)